LFNLNLLRGKGLLAKAIMKAQAASTNFTHVFAALVAIINTKLPDLVKLLVHRVLLQFKRAYKRSNRLQCISSLKMIAHLINQQVIDELVALQLLSLFLENPTEDSIDVASKFMLECGQVLCDVSPAGVSATFDRFRQIL
jgi:pre-mRNA-splicing factor CWC22